MTDISAAHHSENAPLLHSRHRPKEFGYSLDVFGRAEYRDPVVPVQILMVMMGFAILPINNIFTETHVSFIDPTAIVCGTTYLLAYMFYLTEYYDRLWEPYYLLPEDKLFFRFYSITVGIVVIALMQRYPQHWSAYVLILFLIMYLKKASTRNAYRIAVEKEYGSVGACPNNVIKSKYRLAEAFTSNFLIWGFFFLLPFSVLMTASYFLYYWGITLHINSRVSLGPAVFEWTYIVISSLITLMTVIFWKNKITCGILEMKEQVEEGNHEFFR